MKIIPNCFKDWTDCNIFKIFLLLLGDQRKAGHVGEEVDRVRVDAGHRGAAEGPDGGLDAGARKTGNRRRQNTTTGKPTGNCIYYK